LATAIVISFVTASAAWAWWFYSRWRCFNHLNAIQFVHVFNSSVEDGGEVTLIID
jgi:hypothetical protein